MRHRPGQPRVPGQVGGGTGRAVPADDRHRHRLHRDAPVRQPVAAGAYHHGGVDGEQPVQAPARVGQAVEARRSGTAQRQRRLGAGAGKAGAQPRAGGHCVVPVQAGQEDRRAARIVRRGDPGLEQRLRAEWHLQPGPEAGREADRRVAPGQEQRHRQRRQQGRGEPVTVVRAQAEAGRAGGQALQPGPGAPEVRLPDQDGIPVRARCRGRMVRQGGQRAVGQARGPLDPPVPHRHGRSLQGPEAVLQRSCQPGRRQQQKQRVQPDRQALRQGKQGQHRHPEHDRPSRKDRRPELLDPQHAPGAAACPVQQRQGVVRRVRQAHPAVPARPVPSQSGTLSPAHSASTGWRARIVAQRAPSTRAWAASGRAL